MSDLRTTLGADRVEVFLDEAAFPRDAVYAAAFAFTDRCYVRLDRADGGQLGVVLRAKGGAEAFDGDGTAAELRNELFAQAFRQRLVESGREMTSALTTAAFGPPQPAARDGAGEAPAGPGGNALLADLAEAPFDDPLGIAMSWEQKHAEKAAQDGSVTAPTGAGEGEQGT